MKMIGLLLLILSGCGSASWREVERLDTVSVTWERVADTQAVCGKRLSGGMIYLACASYDWATKICTIRAEAGASEWILGHELKHCFGWTHD